MIAIVLAILVQMNPNRSRFAYPYDTTQGVPKGFYYFSGAVLLIIALGVAKSFWDDKEWRGRFFSIPDKKKKQTN